MKIEEIQVIGKKLVLAKAKEVESFESDRWLKFPAAYREFITTLGEGVLGGAFVRVYPPWRIEKELDDWRQRINKYWFWEKGRKLLPKERALECVILGDTLNGDELVFHPMHPNQLFVLPRGGKTVFLAGTDLLSAVDWMCASGKLTRPFVERQFVPFDSRKADAEPSTESKRSIDPEGESLNDIIEVGKRWAKRHGVAKIAKEKLKEYSVPDRQITLLCEAFVLDGEYEYGPGDYMARYRIDDKPTGLHVGDLTIKIGDSSSGLCFNPNQANWPKFKKKD